MQATGPSPRPRAAPGRASVGGCKYACTARAPLIYTRVVLLLVLLLLLYTCGPRSARRVYDSRFNDNTRAHTV